MRIAHQITVQRGILSLVSTGHNLEIASKECERPEMNINDMIEKCNKKDDVIKKFELC